MKNIFTYLIMLAFCFLVLFPVTSCQTLRSSDQRAQLRASQEAFKTVVNSLTALRKAGKIDDEKKAKILAVIKSTDGYLKLWEESVLAGKSSPELGKLVKQSIQTLKQYKLLE